MFDILNIIAAAGIEGGADAAANTLTGKFGVNWSFFIAQSINFIIVAVVLWKFAFKPVTKTLEERKRKIADGLQFAEEMRERLTATEKEIADKLREAADEAARLVKEARDNASAYSERQAQEAIQKAEQIVAKAQEAMAQERKQMLAEVRQEVAKLVVQTSAKVLARELSSEERTRFAESAAKEIYANN